MSYINFTNPEDKNSTDWVQIPDKNKRAKTSETKIKQDVRGVFTKMKTEKKSISASAVQEELIARGITPSTDPSMVPNGVTCSSAGILIALDFEPNAKQRKDIEDAIEAASNREQKDRDPENSGASKRSPDIQVTIE